MLEKPDLPDSKIVACLKADYGLPVAQVAFLPLGADRNTAVYRAVTDLSAPYFVKLRRGDFDDVTVAVPKLLHDQGVPHIIAPLSTRSGHLWAALDDFKVSLYPFVEGRDGFDIGLSDHHWVDFGRALKGMHTTAIPPALTARIQHESYSAYWREVVKGFQARLETTTFIEPIAAQLAAFLKLKQNVIDHLVDRAHHLAHILQSRSLPFVLCHADIHAGNILIDNHDRLYIVDWDTLTFAPKERDLMFVGGGLGGDGHTAAQEEHLFYEGYGQTQIDPVALTYYRYERIVQDIAAYCEQILLTDKGGEDRQEGLQQLMSQFLPNAVVDMAYRTEHDLPPDLRAT